MNKSDSILLPNGQLIPILGFGTWQANEEELMNALDAALKAGYRHIDTAAAYENEKAIGKVLKKWFDSGELKRSEVFIVTKLPATGNRPEHVEKWIKKSLQDLQLEYLDLYLIHVPFGFEEVGDELHPVDKDGQMRIDPSTDFVKVWAEMEKQVERGLTKAIGLSNFNIKQIERVLNNAKINISMLQIEYHVYFQQRELINYCKSKNIPVTAYSPLGTRNFVKLMNKENEVPDLLQSEVVLQIAKNHNKSPAQILLRYIIQNRIIAIPKSTNVQRIKENIQIFDWTLNPEDIEKLKALDCGEAGRICDFSFFKGIRRHPEFPF